MFDRLLSYVLNVLYVGLLIAACPWLAYAAIRHGKYRQGWGAKLLGLVPQREGAGPCIWLHGVSVGEINLLVPLVNELRRQLPQHPCVVSTTTRTGYELARVRFAGHTVFYCPLDFSWAVAAAMRRMRPQLLVLAELELWPNLIRAARHSGARVAVVNGRLSLSSWRGYRRVPRLARRMLGGLDLIAAQNDEFAQRFLDLGAPAAVVCVTGSVKFDGAECDRDNPRTRQLVGQAGIAPEDIVFLAGSTQAPEESLALEVFQRLATRFPRLRLILVPRHRERFDEVASLLQHSGVAWQRRSLLPEGPSSAAPTRVLLVDTIGELGAWWGTAHVAFVGGSLGRRGGQNMIEPAAYGAAVSFGPHTHNFRDVAAAMLEAGAATVVADSAELYDFVARCLEDPQFRHQRGHRAQQLVDRHRGATSRTVALLRQLVPTDGLPHLSVGRLRSACLRSGASHTI